MDSDKVKELTIEEFSKKASSYDNIYSWMVNEDYPLIVSELAQEPFSSVLDCGCGTGGLLYAISNITPPPVMSFT